MKAALPYRSSMTLASQSAHHAGSHLGFRDTEVVGNFDLIYREFSRVEFSLRVKPSTRFLDVSKNQLFATLFLSPSRSTGGWDNSTTHLAGVEFIHAPDHLLLQVKARKSGDQQSQESTELVGSHRLPIASNGKFVGDDKWQNVHLMNEATATVRLAQALGPRTDLWEGLVDLATGNLDWIFGRHIGVRGRYSSEPSTLEFASVSTVANLGSASVAQAVWGIHLWDQPTVLRGIGGRSFDDDSPETSPWDHLPSNTQESFIFNDGQMLIACELLSRTLHPSLVIEAEEWSRAEFTPRCESNNVESEEETELARYNGGKSVVGTRRGDWLEYEFEPPQFQRSADEFFVSMRVANSAEQPVSLRLSIAPGTALGAWSSVLDIPPTGHRHEYIVEMASTRAVLRDRSYRLKVVFEGDGLSLDAIVIKNRGTHDQSSGG